MTRDARCGMEDRAGTSRCRVTGVLLVGLHLVFASPTAAQETADRGGGGIFGRVPDDPVSMGSMVLTVHPFIDTSQHDLVSDDFDGGYVRVSQFFVALFKNSYGGESWLMGVERHWGSASLGPLDVGVGYRAGIVTGYDERLIGFARHTPVLPVGGVVGWAHGGPAGVNLFWAYRAVSLEAAIRCC